MTRRDPHAIRTFEEFRDAIFAYQLPRILLTALDFDLFTVMGRRSWTLAALATRLRASRRGLAVLCRNLASVGLLHKRGETYRNGTLGRTALNAGHPAYRGAYLRLLRNHWDDWSRLTAQVRSGKALDHDEPDSPAYRREFSWAMHHRSVRIAAQVAAQVKLEGAGTFLDLGGGPGTYALAFLAKNLSLRATVCDRAAALDVARELAAASPHGSRLSYLPLDFMTRRIPGRYDVIWYSNVLHIYSETDNRKLFRRLTANLNPGGRLIIQDALLHDRQGLYPQEATLFSVMMLLLTERGDTYRAAAAASWLRKAGFEKIRPIRVKKGTEDWEGGLLEARLPVRYPGSRARRRRSAKN